MAIKVTMSSPIQRIGVSQPAKPPQVGIDNDLKFLKGQDGESAYDIAKKLGFVGTESEWIESLHAVNPDVLEDIRQAKATAGEALQRVGSLEVEVGDASILLSLI